MPDSADVCVYTSSLTSGRSQHADADSFFLLLTLYYVTQREYPQLGHVTCSKNLLFRKASQ